MNPALIIIATIGGVCGLAVAVVFAYALYDLAAVLRKLIPEVEELHQQLRGLPEYVHQLNAAVRSLDGDVFRHGRQLAALVAVIEAANRVAPAAAQASTLAPDTPEPFDEKGANWDISIPPPSPFADESEDGTG